MKKRLSLIMLMAFTFVWCCPCVAAAENRMLYQQEAQYLVNSGVIRGTGQGLELDQPATRLQGTVILVRLLGQEGYAIKSSYRHPFNDIPPWADSYVAFLYNAGLCKGTGLHSFSPDSGLNARQFVSMLLRALGYQDSQGDFTYENALTKAVQSGLITPQDEQFLENLPEFSRNEMVYLSFRALQARYKGSVCTLSELVSGIDSGPQAGIAWNHPQQRLVIKFPEFNPSTPNCYTVDNYHQLCTVLKNSLSSLQSSLKIDPSRYDGDISEDFQAAIDEAGKNIDQTTGLARLLKSWRYQEDMYGDLHMSLEYYYSYSQLSLLEQKTMEILGSTISPGMSEYDKEKNLHDYIVNHTRYDYENMLRNTVPAHSYTPYGVLVMGCGVCQGYAEAMHLLCTQVGLDSTISAGTALHSGSWINHAWNIIRINGDYYHVDTSWDDITIGGKERLRYTYFNLPDSDMILDHRWKQSDYPSCSSTQYNYFIRNNLLLENFNAFTTYINKTLSSHSDEIHVKIDNFNMDKYEDLSTIMFQNPYVQRYYYNIDERQGVISIYDIVYQ